jgi:YrbI family 3-deoxy-D-manno-octulosonate 8-phosphate phosphatase
MTKSIQEKLKAIRLFVTDFDGIHTDASVYCGQDGYEMVKCSRRDSLGLGMLKKVGIGTAVISKETNPVVTARCKKIKVRCYQKVEDADGKLEILKREMEKRGLLPENVLYMGDDLNDRACLEYVGVPVTVPDGHPSIKEISLIITEVDGGNGAIREVAEMVLVAQGHPIRF